VLGSQGQPDWVVGTAAGVPMLAGLYILFALKVANEWEKAVVLRAGKFRGLPSEALPDEDGGHPAAGGGIPGGQHRAIQPADEHADSFHFH
jgi:hypothetical protein